MPIILIKSDPVMDHPIHCRRKVQLITQGVKLESRGYGLRSECSLVNVERVGALMHFYGLIHNWVKVHTSGANTNDHQCSRGKLSTRHWCDGSVGHSSPTKKKE